jgi:beta-glucosidase
MSRSLAKKYLFFVLILSSSSVLFLFFSMSSLFESEYPNVPSGAIYLNPNASTEERVKNLLSYMTLEEKIGQMALVEKNSIESLSDISTYGIGGMLSGFGGKPEDNTAEGWKNMVHTFVEESHSSRLGIPVLYGVDAIHGHSNVRGATVFPHFISLGATGNEELVEKIARATAEELRYTDVRWSYSPTYDMPEDIRWGRVYETFSDDPALVGKLGSAYIRGLQQNPARPSSTIEVLATPKHFIGAGSMLWNTSSNPDFKIDQGTTPPNEAKLRNHYLPPFVEAVNTGALSIMVGLNSWGDTKLAASSYLIQTILKNELGFQGFVVSDWYGVYEIPGGNYHAAVTAINSGVDMVMLPFNYKEFVANVRTAVSNGDIARSRIDDAVSRILTAKFALGLFDEPEVNASHAFGSEEHRALARTAVSESLVLLKNKNSILPLRDTPGTLRIAGSAADNIGRQTGAWTVEWQGIDGNWLPGATSILEGIRQTAPQGTVIEFEKDGHFDAMAPKASIGIAIVGEGPYAEGWGDNARPVLSTEDRATIVRLKKVSDKVIVILVTGRPLIITNEIDAWDSVVAAWLPGSEGAGVGDVLFGKQPFTGKLPIPWPRGIEQLPITQKGTRDGAPPLFPRYFGLTN